MSATPEVRWLRKVGTDHIQGYEEHHSATFEILLASGLWEEVTVSPVTPQGAATPADEAAEMARSLAEVTALSGGDARLIVNAASALAASPADEASDPDVTLMRRAAASERAAERHWPADMLMEAADTIECLRATSAASPADADTADLDSAVGIIEGVQHALALTRGARVTAEERVYTTEANRLIHEKRERMLQSRLTDGTTAGRTYARTGGDEHATTPPVAATSEEGR